MINTNYTSEIAIANNFILEHKDDKELLDFLHQMSKPFYTHSDRWSRVFDWMNDHYPEATGSLITGLVYYSEG